MIPTDKEYKKFREKLESMPLSMIEEKLSQGIWNPWKVDFATRYLQEEKRQEKLKLEVEAIKIAKKAFWCSALAIILSIIALIHKW